MLAAVDNAELAGWASAGRRYEIAGKLEERATAARSTLACQKSAQEEVLAPDRRQEGYDGDTSAWRRYAERWMTAVQPALAESISCSRVSVT